MKIRWTDKALDNLQNIHDYIAQDSRFYALRMIDRLTSRSKQIAFMPFSGRKVPEYQTENIRELIEEPYRMIYRINEDSVDILTVIHGARLLPNDLK